jgi:NADPH-dependent glutamate synthase beta subunit-like oxidoreductase
MSNHQANFVDKAKDAPKDSGQVKRFRFDLFEKIPFLKKFCKWRSFQFLVVFPNLVIFLFFLYAGLFGSRVGNRNIIIIFVWIFWWFLWCTVCPFPFFGEWFQRRALIKVRSGKTGVLRNKMFGLNKRWPKALSNIWLQNIAFLGICTFSAHLLTRPIVSVLVLGGLFAIATVLALFFRQRAFCMYVCPVSGFQGLYAMTSMIEMRAKDSTICNRIKPGLEYSFEAGIAPCWSACPAGVDASGYISLIKEKKYEEALELIREALPFVSICGRVCHHPCESQCVRGKIDEPVSICKLKRFVAERGDRSEVMPQEPTKPRFAEKVAIVGGGPCGLTCAYHLAREGYKVEVFESQPVAGGMLRLAIPDYRLPQEVVDKEVDFIKSTGVQINTGVEIGKKVSFDELRTGYSAIFVTVGASKSKALRIEGEQLEGVLNAIDFLRNVKMQEKVKIGRKVLVIGGGDTAVDSARTALRLGASEVVIIYRRGKEQMPAIADEIEAAEAEGVRIETLLSPLKILSENGRATSLLCTKMKLVESDATGRPKPVPIEGSEQLIIADNVIIATGQYSDISFLPKQLAVSDMDTLFANKDTLATNIPGVFAGGDLVTGPSMLIYAIASGRKAAMSIHRYLRGEKLDTTALHPTDIVSDTGPPSNLHKIQRTLPNRLDFSMHENRFAEVEQVFTEQMALDEAGRCLSCGICGDCFHGTERGWACPWFQTMGTMERNNYCSMCMECLKSCPHDNIGLFTRPFAQDKKIKGYDESWKAFIMLALAMVYSVTLLGPWGTIKEWANVAETGNWKGFGIYAGIIWVTALLAIPAVWALTSWLGKLLAGVRSISTKEIFIKYSYMLVPLGLLAWIAFSFPLIMINGSYVISIISDPLGWGWDLLGTASVPWNPILPEYTVYIQIPLLLFGLYIALKRGYDISLTLYQDKSQAVRSLIPTGIVCAVIIFAFLKLFTG